MLGQQGQSSRGEHKQMSTMHLIDIYRATINIMKLNGALCIKRIARFCNVTKDFKIEFP